MFVLTIILEKKIKGTRLKFSLKEVRQSYKIQRVELTSKLKSAAKNKTGATLRITKENFQDKELPHELFLTTRQKTKIRNVFANEKLGKAKLSKTIQLGKFLSVMLDKYSGPLMKVAVRIGKMF